MDEQRILMQIPQPPHHLPKHHPRIVLWQSRRPIPLQNVVQGTRWAIKRDEIVSIGCVDRGKERENMLVAEAGPDLGFVLEFLAFVRRMTCPH
jgi:hypothetical protein